MIIDDCLSLPFPGVISRAPATFVPRRNGCRIVMNVLFVCTANIVRSFMAEAILKEKLKAAGRQNLTVSSAALIDMQGRPADPLAVKVLKEHRIESSGHISRLLTDEMVVNADLIVVMEERQQYHLTERYPEAQERIRILKSFTKGYQGLDSDIADPYRLTRYHYRRCFSDIFTAVEGMLEVL